MTDISKLEIMSSQNSENKISETSYNFLVSISEMIKEIGGCRGIEILVAHNNYFLYKSKKLDEILSENKNLSELIEHIIFNKLSSKIISKDFIVYSHIIYDSSIKDNLFIIMVKRNNNNQNVSISMTDKCYHDIQEPLRNIANFLQLLNLHSEEINDPISKKYISYALDSVYRLKEWTSDLLKKSKNEMLSSAKHEKSSITSIIDEIKQMISYQMSSKNCIVEVDDSIPELNCSHVDVFSIFKNLIENSIKHSSTSDLTIKISKNEDIDNIKDYVSICYEDNGKELSTKDTNNILSSLDEMNTSSIHPGFGLTMCVEIVKSYGGSIKFEKDNINNTYKFIISLPIYL